MAFHVGQKVVAVNTPDEIRAMCAHGEKTSATVGKIYTVRDVDSRYLARWGYAGLRLQEITARSVWTVAGWIEPAFLSVGFRPLTERKADMEARNELFRKWETHKEKRVTAPLDEQA
jgi:hypothetical protein